MTDYGLTSTGFRRKTYAEIVASMKAFLRGRIAPNLVLDETTPEGNITEITADELDSAWEAIEAAIGALDPDNAVDALLVALCKLTGIQRKAATKGTVSVDVTFDQATTISAGSLILAVDGEATNLWSNDDDIDVAAAGTESFDFTSTTAGADAVALAGTLTVIATPTTGVTSVTNPTDATPGTDIEDLDALRLRREASLGATGKGTVAAIRAALIGDDTGNNPGVDGVVDVRVIENDTNATVDGIPARTIHVVVWDGSGSDADDDEIAQAIYDAKGAGTSTYGSESGTATDPQGDSKTVFFDRAVELEAYILITVTGDTTETLVKTALLASHSEVLSEDLLRAALFAAGFQTDGVTNVTALTLGLAPAPAGTSDIAADDDEVVTLDSTRIGVTIS
jgi:uncharacterized phage protein gp47/JayE